MQVNLSNILKFNDKIAVAVSGGCDSMCLLHFLYNNANKYGVSIIALNVEHGIRGQSSISDTQFVKDFCRKNNIKLLTYSVDSLAFAKENKLSLEQAARILRYECFEDALKSGECNKIATAHHQDDNVESILFNIFRGTGLKGIAGIEKVRTDNIIRPFLDVSRIQIEQYAKANDIPFVTDETNLSDDYTRNYLRLNVIPKIKEIYPELNKSITRLSQLASQDEEYMESVAKSYVKIQDNIADIDINCPLALVGRATIIALKGLGVKKDWEKTHIDCIIKLIDLENGSKTCLLDGIIAIREYDKIVFYRENKKEPEQTAFKIGEIKFKERVIIIREENLGQLDIKSGLFADLDKIPKTAVIRTRKDGDVFTKFGGGTKTLNDYFTDKKIPLRKRDDMLLLADGNCVLVIFGLAISEKLKVNEFTKKIVSFKV